MAAVMTTVVLESKGRSGKRYRADRPEDTQALVRAASRLADMEGVHEDELALVPNEPIAEDPRGMWCYLYGLDNFGKAFNPRQLLTLTTFSQLIRQAHAGMLAAGIDAQYAQSIAMYLAFAVDRLASDNSTLTRWNPAGPKPQGALGLQGMPLVWDYAELNPWGGSVGDAATSVEILGSTIPSLSESSSRAGHVEMRDARVQTEGKFKAIITDPPYYDSIDYANVSDFYYVWLKRSIGFLHRDLLGLPLTPKRNQIVMNPYTNGEAEGDRREAARRRYVDGMAVSFGTIAQSLEPDAIVGVVFAHTDPDAWATLIEGLLEAALVPDASWPLDTEMGTKFAGMTSAKLKTSVWMACTPRLEDAGQAFIGDVTEEMRPVIRNRLLYFWSMGIRGADFFISAIGPALSVFGKHSRVLRPDGSQVTVREFLDLVRRESTQVALEQVLQGADLGIVDPVTRQYVTWVWSYSRAPLDAGETIALCLATGADYHQAVRPGSIAVEVKEKSKKLVKLRTVRERGRQDEDLGEDSPARPAPLIDQLQRAAYLWGLNKSEDLASYRSSLGETRWAALRVLGQAVAECLPDGDEDRRLIHGLLGSNVMARVAKGALGRPAKPAAEGPRLPGFEEGGESDG